MFGTRSQGYRKFEEDGSHWDDEAVVSGRGSGIRIFVGQLCGERRNVFEEMVCILVERGLPFLPRDCQGRWPVDLVK